MLNIAQNAKYRSNYETDHEYSRAILFNMNAGNGGAAPPPPVFGNGDFWWSIYVN